MQPVLGGRGARPGAICTALPRGTTVSDSTSSLHDDQEFDPEFKEAVVRGGFSVFVMSLVSNEFLDLLASKDPAKEKKARSLRGKAIASFDKMTSDVEMGNDLQTMPDPAL
ncbi:hypothetical protein FOA52_015825 [Chlamydomonas sp. UWO 241]|nr:hypothetical protein FOA52_015825 [Chlamydomonas sp. UWO 241]